jgi:hypothetical protein
MEKIISYCGLVCSDCPAFIATQKNDDAERKKVAETWSKEFKKEIKPEDINCDGCLVDSDTVFNYCKVCEIRKCAKDRVGVNCAYCDDYGCEKLTKFFDMVPDAKKRLDEVRKNL